MNPNKFNNNAEALTINECRRAGRKNTPGHSKGKPAVSSMTTNISVRFAALLPVEIAIRRVHETTERESGAVPPTTVARKLAVRNGKT